jgi:hypothetical protein
MLLSTTMSKIVSTTSRRFMRTLARSSEIDWYVVFARAITEMKWQHLVPCVSIGLDLANFEKKTAKYFDDEV